MHCFRDHETAPGDGGCVHGDCGGVFRGGCRLREEVAHRHGFEAVVR